MKRLFISPIAIALLLFSNLSFSASQTLKLGILTTFEAYTGGGAVSNAAGAQINGDVGTHFGAITGAYDYEKYNHYNADDVTDDVRKDLLRIYIHLNDIPVNFPGNDGPAHAAAFGAGETIYPGVYSIGGAGSIGGKLTLDGDGDEDAFFIIKYNGAMTVGAGSEVILTDEVKSANVFWIANGAISVAAGAKIKGTLFSKAGAVGLGAGVQLEGRMLTMGGAITTAVDAVASPPKGFSSIPISCDMGCSSKLESFNALNQFALFSSFGAVANTGITGLIGDIGSNGGAISGFNGIHIGKKYTAGDGDVTAEAKEALDAAYDQLMGLEATDKQHTPSFGSGETLPPGVYDIGGAGSLSGTITLDGGGDSDAIFVMRFAGAFNTAAQSKVILTGGAKRCNVFWLGGAGVTTGAVNIGAASHVKGFFFSHGGASNSGAAVFLGGRQLSTSGAVNTNTAVIYTNPECVTSRPLSFQLDHFKVGHDESAINCQAENITISAHTSPHIVDTTYTGTVELSTSSNNGYWSFISGSNEANLTNNGNGFGTYTFDGTEGGIVKLGLLNTVEETININVKVDDGGIESNTSGNADDTDNKLLKYEAAGFIFHDGSNDKKDIGMQIAGKPSNIGYGAQPNLILEAVITNTKTGACEAALTDDIEVNIGFECRSPSTCQRPLYLGSGSVLEQILPTNANSPVNYKEVSLNFGDTDTGDSTANFVMNYPDAGQIRLHAEYTIDNTIVLQGISNEFVSRPFGFDLVVTDNPEATDHTGGILTKSGNPFTVTATAVLWDSIDDSNNDGIPDNHNDSDPSLRAVLSNNSVPLGSNNYHSALNFGLENENITLTVELSLPSGGINNPLLSGSIIGDFTDGTGSNSEVIYDEVGIIELNATISDKDYLNIGESETLKMLSQSGYVGRFVPASFDVAVTNSGSFDNTCTTGITPFTYIGQDFGFLIAPTFSVTAKNASNETTRNYRGDFVKLGISSITVDPVTADSTNVGSDNVTPLLVSQTVNAAMTAVADNNGTVNYTLGADKFKYGPDPESLDISKESNSEVYPFTANIAPVISFVDDGEVSNEVTEVVSIDGNEQRFGRIDMTNTHGSELNDLKMPMTIKYLNDKGIFVINTDDNNCTQIDTGDLNFTFTPSTSNSDVTITNTPAEAGRHVDITAPGNGNNDVVRVSPNLDTSDNKWLRYDWEVDGNFNDDPSATATFGIHKGNPVQIFMRQSYQ